MPDQHGTSDSGTRRTATRQPPTGRWSAPELGVVAVTVGLALLLTFPLYAVANQAQPFVLGMPLSMFWVVAWVAVEFVVLLAVYFWEYGRRSDQGNYGSDARESTAGGGHAGGSASGRRSDQGNYGSDARESTAGGGHAGGSASGRRSDQGNSEGGRR